MPRTRSYSDTDKSVAFTFLKVVSNGKRPQDTTEEQQRRAARFASVEVAVLRHWIKELDTAEVTAQAIIAARPRPPLAMIDDMSPAGLFAPAPDLLEWVTNTILATGGALHNPEHGHLCYATLGFLWTNIGNVKGGKQVAGTAEMGEGTGAKWVKGRQQHLFRLWFGQVPDFVITLDATWAFEADDASFCGLVEHEMYHCGQRTYPDGTEALTPDGDPVWTLRPHDFEGFVGVTRRYGYQAAEGGVRELVEASRCTPEIAPALLDIACGACN